MSTVLALAGNQDDFVDMVVQDLATMHYAAIDLDGMLTLDADGWEIDKKMKSMISHLDEGCTILWYLFDLWSRGIDLVAQKIIPSG
ncbi:MAG: hypothetical protein R3D33_00860 [Hyphomicrobiaceae bacterium]